MAVRPALIAYFPPVVLGGGQQASNLRAKKGVKLAAVLNSMHQPSIRHHAQAPS